MKSVQIVCRLRNQICARVMAKHALKKSPLAKPNYEPVTPNEIRELQEMGFVVSVNGQQVPVQSKLF
jgi:hypothetical protein